MYRFSWVLQCKHWSILAFFCNPKCQVLLLRKCTMASVDVVSPCCRHDSATATWQTRWWRRRIGWCLWTCSRPCSSSTPPSGSHLIKSWSTTLSKCATLIPFCGWALCKSRVWLFFFIILKRLGNVPTKMPCIPSPYSMCVHAVLSPALSWWRSVRGLLTVGSAWSRPPTTMVKWAPPRFPLLPTQVNWSSLTPNPTIIPKAMDLFTQLQKEWLDLLV